MSPKFVCVLALFLGLNLWPAAAARFHLHHSRKISKLSGEPLIQNACRGLGENEAQCISTLQAAPANIKAHGHDLSFFTLRYVEDHAVNVSKALYKIARDPDLSPLLQSAVSDCMDQYNSFDDLINDSLNAILSNMYTDAAQFTEAAISNVEMCDSQLTASYLEEKSEPKPGEELQLAKDLKDNNVFLKYILTAALNILKAN